MSDHKDAQAAIQNPECDIGDFWAYHTGTGDSLPESIVFAMSVNPGEVGRIRYGPRGARSQDAVTTVPEHMRGNQPSNYPAGRGTLSRGDRRRSLTPLLRFDPDAVYEFRISIDKSSRKDGNDYVADVSFKITFDGWGGEQTMSLTRADKAKHRPPEEEHNTETGDRSGERMPLTVPGEPGAVPHSSVGPDITVAEFRSSSGAAPIRLYAGHRQDPFFFNFQGIDAELAYQFRKELCKEGAPSGGLSDAFTRGYNISAIVLEVPIRELFPGQDVRKMFTWSATTLQGHPVDRAGYPLHTAVFLPKVRFGPVLDSFNTAPPRNHAAFRPLVAENLKWTLNDPLAGWDENAILDTFIPDVLPIDLDRPAGLFNVKKWKNGWVDEVEPPNGRRLTHDDPTEFFVTLLDHRAYESHRQGSTNFPGENPIKTNSRQGFLAKFPYLPPPGAARARGWNSDPIKSDPRWPVDGKYKYANCDEYLDTLRDPTGPDFGTPPTPSRGSIGLTPPAGTTSSSDLYGGNDRVRELILEHEDAALGRANYTEGL